MIVAKGAVIGARGGRPYGAHYRIVCDGQWHMQEFFVALTDGRRLRMSCDGAGHWCDGDGKPVPAFDGCIDIDLAATPFTNTLPVRRCRLRKGDTRELRMLYVPFDTLVPAVDSQRYTCLEEADLYLYEAEDRSFAAELPVDRDGLVGDYPTLFRRVA